MATSISGANFSQILNLCKDGYPIRRQSWPEGTNVTLRKGTVSAAVTDDFVNAVPRNLFDVAEGPTSMPSLVWTNAAGSTNAGWTAELIDLLAADWVALDQPDADDPSATTGNPMV